jgi:hypothetical protein
MENYNNNTPDIFSLEVDDFGKSTFLEMTRWTKFLAILGYVFIGLMVLVGVGMAMLAGKLGDVAGNPMAGMGGMPIFIMVLFLAAIYFYPIYALMRYSSTMKMALNTNSKERFNDAIVHLKNMFKYLGILMIIGLCLYAAMFVFIILGATMGSR